MTRNKLTFRDPLPTLLAEATPTDRQLERRLREWLRECHTRLDRIVRFSGPADVELKVTAEGGPGSGLGHCAYGALVAWEPWRARFGHQRAPLPLTASEAALGLLERKVQRMYMQALGLDWGGAAGCKSPK